MSEFQDGHFLCHFDIWESADDLCDRLDLNEVLSGLRSGEAHRERSGGGSEVQIIRELSQVHNPTP